MTPATHPTRPRQLTPAGTPLSGEAVSGRPVTGRTVLVWLIGFFLVIFAANVVFVRLALTSFPGLVTDSAYEEGLAYNATIAAARAQAALGWTLDGSVRRDEATGAATLAVTARDRDGNPLSGLVVTARLQRTASPEAPRLVVLTEGELGRYGADLADAASGNWLLEIDAARGEGEAREAFRSENRIFLR